jgi:hypothetical protein
MHLADLRAADIALVVSTVLAPVIAVQVSQMVDRKRQMRADRYNIFRTLMVTRAATLDPRHVESLNMIDIVFTGRGRLDRAVRECWRRYLTHLNNFNTYPQPAWGPRRIELMSELLYALARSLKFDIDRSLIETAVYLPSAFGTVEQEQQKLRAGLLRVVDGEAAIPVRLVDAQPQPAVTQKPVLAQPAVVAGNGAAGPPPVAP